MLRHLKTFSSCSSRNRRARKEELSFSLRLSFDKLNSLALQPPAEYEEVDSHHYEDVIEPEVYEVQNTGQYVIQAYVSTQTGSSDYSGCVPMDHRRE